MYVVLKDGRFLREDGGYTTLKAEAGRYTLEQIAKLGIDPQICLAVNEAPDSTSTGGRFSPGLFVAVVAVIIVVVTFAGMVDLYLEMKNNMKHSRTAGQCGFRSYPAGHSDLKPATIPG